jgi:predicted TIM-barrel fold metal-dependent hydrolase
MAYPSDVGVIDLMIGFPMGDKKATYDYLMKGIKDAESKDSFSFPAEYMFKDVPEGAGDGVDPVDECFREMDKYNVEQGLFGNLQQGSDAQSRYPGRVHLSLEVDPNDVMGTVAKIKGAHAKYGIKAVTLFPSGCLPQVNVDDARVYPAYAACVELGIPIIVNAGIAGPRFPSDCQHVMRFDNVCYDFPDLQIVMRHGAEPWEDLAVKLMLKWPGLYYMTSAFAPKYYPKAIVEYANTRGADKIMYAGYYPMGLSLERIFTEMPNVPFRDPVWPQFLRENALRVFKLEST